MVPSSCHGVVFAPGKGKCQEMLSLRIVGTPGARCRRTSASSMVRPTSARTVSGVVLRTATRALDMRTLLLSDERAPPAFRIGRPQLRLERHPLADPVESHPLEKLVDPRGIGAAVLEARQGT